MEAKLETKMKSDPSTQAQQLPTSVSFAPRNYLAENCMWIVTSAMAPVAKSTLELTGPLIS